MSKRKKKLRRRDVAKPCSSTFGLSVFSRLEKAGGSSVSSRRASIFFLLLGRARAMERNVFWALLQCGAFSSKSSWVASVRPTESQIPCLWVMRSLREGSRRRRRSMRGRF